MTRTRIWALFTALAVGIIIFGGYALVLSPKRTELANLRSQRVAAAQQIALLHGQLAQLDAMARRLPVQQQRLAAFATKFPPTVALPDLIRSLTADAQAAGAAVTVLTPSAPTLPGAVAGGTGTPAPPAGGSGTPASYVEVPLSVTVEGSYAQLTAFLGALEGMPRAVLVSAVSINRAQSGTATASDGSPLLDVTLTASAFAAPTASAGSAGSAGSGAAGSLPSAPSTGSGSSGPPS